MHKFFSFIVVIVLLTGCATSDVTSLVRAAASSNPSSALQTLAKNRSLSYARNPKRLVNDIKSLSHFIEKISSSWGEKNVALPSKKEYVKYMQNYKSRAFIDFVKGIVRVETLNMNNSKQSLKNAIVTTLLLPSDPRGADLFGASEVKLGATPYLFGEVKDDQDKSIRYSWRANRFADILLKHSYKTKNISINNTKQQVAFVEFEMVKDHADVRVRKYKNFVETFAKKYDVSKNLVYAIIKTESNFNQFAISNAGAYGLMQIVPKTAGIDAYNYTKGKKWKPTKEYLFDAKNNIELGTAYLRLLDTEYLSGIYNNISREYCVITAYNTGSGNVLKAFSTDRQKAKNIINAQKPSQVYDSLQNNLKYDEPKRYLKKVLTFKKDFVRL